MIVRFLAISVLIALSLMPWRIAQATAGGSAGTVPAARQRAATWHVLLSARSAPRLSQPHGLAIDTRGSSVNKWIYVADTGNNRIVKFGTGGRYLGSWGRKGLDSGQFNQPEGVAVNAQGAVYVADTGNNRIQEFDSNGHFLTMWGAKGTAPGQFSDPTAVTVGGSGNVFVADRQNKRIQKFSATGGILARWWPSIPTGSTAVGFGPTGPYALTVDRAGNIIAAVDTGQCSGGHCVMDYDLLQTFSPAGTVLRSIVGGNPYGAFSYPPIPGVSTRGPWWQIGALTSDARGRLFLSEWNSDNRASVTELSSGGKRLGQWELPAPSGARGWPGQGIAVDPAGSAYVADTPANRILKLTLGPSNRRSRTAVNLRRFAERKTGGYAVRQFADRANAE